MNTIELIDRYIDNQLPQDQAQQIEKTLQEDAELQRLLESVKVARKVIQFRALTIKMKGLHEKHIQAIRNEQRIDNVIPMPVNRSYSWVTRIAASVILILVSYGTYQYVSLDTVHLYNDKFISYYLPTTRSSAKTQSSLNALYSSGNYAAVIQHFNKLPDKVASDYFLTGVSYLHQKEYKQAINTLKQLREYNNNRSDDYFVQETDYYLALAYLGDNKVEQSYKLFEAIHHTPRHMFSETVTDLDMIKLRILLLKE